MLLCDSKAVQRLKIPIAFTFFVFFITQQPVRDHLFIQVVIFFYCSVVFPKPGKNITLNA